jgi:hypothetical protein
MMPTFLLLAASLIFDSMYARSSDEMVGCFDGESETMKSHAADQISPKQPSNNTS